MKRLNILLVALWSVLGGFLFNTAAFADNTPPHNLVTYNVTVKNDSGVPLVASTDPNNSFMKLGSWTQEAVDLAAGQSMTATATAYSDTGIFAGFTYLTSFNSLEGCQIKFEGTANNNYFYPIIVAAGSDYNCTITAQGSTSFTVDITAASSSSTS